MIRPTKLRNFALGASLLAMASSPALSETMLRYAEGSPNRGVRAEALQYFADQLEERTDGELALEIHWGGGLLKYTSILGGVSVGTADMGTVLSAFEPQKMRALSVGDLPLTNADPWVGLKSMHELMHTNEQLQEALAESDVVYIGNYTTTGMQFECAGDTRIETLEDFKGKKVRASSIYAKILDELGANMVNFTHAEVYQALETGLVDCSGAYLYTMRAFKTPEVVNSVALMNWGQLLGFAMVMNRWTWDSLSEEQQATVRSVSSDMIDTYARNLIRDAETVLSQLPTGELGNEVEVIRWPDEERERLAQYSDKYIQQWIEDMNEAGFDGAAIWEQYQVLLDKYEQELEEQGYPWERA